MADENDIGAKSHEEIIKKQDYNQLWESCTKQKTLFKDDLFSPKNCEDFFSRGKFAGKKIEWLRPHSLCKEPHFIEGHASRFDVDQGQLDDCWFLSAVSDLTLRPALFAKVVPKQSFHVEYAGIFRFHFYQYGEWISVVVDDLLPTLNGKLVLGHSPKKNDFWLALLEKAYAKLNGGFEALNFGNSCEAFVDFTGGVAEVFTINNPEEIPANLYSVLYRYYLRNSLICTYIQRSKGNTRDKLANGLIISHEYSVTSMARVNYRGKTVPLIRLRNPWGKGEWNGPWSDSSPEWQSIPKEVKDKVGVSLTDDGEFWMTFSDFIAHFNVFECCHLIEYKGSPEDYHWKLFEKMGIWKGDTAGGCINHKETFWRNPKYLLSLVDKDIDAGIEDNNNHRCTVIISLIQKFYRYRKALKNAFIRIGFVIFHVSDLTEEDKERGNMLEEVKTDEFTEAFFKSHSSIARVPFLEKRGVSDRFHLAPGKYLLVPSTYSPNKEASFMLRVLVSKSTESRDSFIAKHQNRHIPEAFQPGAAFNSENQKSPAKKNSPGRKSPSGKSNSSKSSGKSGKLPANSSSKGTVTVGDPPKAGTNFKLANALEPVKMKLEKKVTTPSGQSTK